MGFVIFTITFSSADYQDPANFKNLVVCVSLALHLLFHGEGPAISSGCLIKGGWQPA